MRVPLMCETSCKAGLPKCLLALQYEQCYPLAVMLMGLCMLADVHACLRACVRDQKNMLHGTYCQHQRVCTNVRGCTLRRASAWR